MFVNLQLFEVPFTTLNYKLETRALRKLGGLKPHFLAVAEHIASIHRAHAIILSWPASAVFTLHSSQDLEPQEAISCLHLSHFDDIFPLRRFPVHLLAQAKNGFAAQSFPIHSAMKACPSELGASMAIISLLVHTRDKIKVLSCYNCAFVS